jgi:hypothetical protein
VSDEQDPPLPVPGTTQPEPGYKGGAEFFMDFATVPGLSKMLDQGTEYARKCERFIREHAELNGGDGLLKELSGKHDGVVDQSASWFRKLADPVLATTTSNVDATIRLFQDTESANAAAIDAGVPSRVDTVDVSLPAWPKTNTEAAGVPYGPFEYIQDPADALRKPRDYEGDPAYQYRPNIDLIFDLGSPASLARSAVVKVTQFLASLGWLDRAYDPYEDFTRPVVGDWAGLRRFADVLRYVGDAAERTGIGVDRARHMLGPVWRGRAADACVVWLGAVAKPMRDVPTALDAMANEYERAVDGAVQYRGLLDSILTSVIDKAFFTATALAIGTGGAPLTGGLSAGAAVLIAGAEIYAIIDHIKNLITAYQKTQGIMNTAAAAMADFGLPSNAQLPNLPPVSGNASALSVLPS